MTIARGLTTLVCLFPWHLVRHRPTGFDYGRNDYGKKNLAVLKRLEIRLWTVLVIQLSIHNAVYPMRTCRHLLNDLINSGYGGMSRKTDKMKAVLSNVSRV